MNKEEIEKELCELYKKRAEVDKALEDLSKERQEFANHMACLVDHFELEKKVCQAYIDGKITYEQKRDSLNNLFKIWQELTRHTKK